MHNNISEFKVESVSVVLVARHHNPSIINPDFLKQNGIINEAWEPASAPIATAPMAQINFKNVQWLVDIDRCLIQENVDGEFQESYSIHECAKKYASVLRYIPYIAIGLNWQLSVAMSDAPNWFRQQFLKPGEWHNKLQPAIFSFRLHVDKRTICTLSMNIAEAAILIDYNFHVDLGNSSDKVNTISDIVDNWKNYQTFTQKTIKEYFR